MRFPFGDWPRYIATCLAMTLVRAPLRARFLMMYRKISFKIIICLLGKELWNFRFFENFQSKKCLNFDISLYILLLKRWIPQMYVVKLRTKTKRIFYFFTFCGWLFQMWFFLFVLVWTLAFHLSAFANTRTCLPVTSSFRIFFVAQFLNAIRRSCLSAVWPLNFEPNQTPCTWLTE